MFVRKLFSSPPHGELPKARGSVVGSAVKYVLAGTAIGSSAFIATAYVSMPITLETRKYVDVELVRSFIPKDRNIFKENMLHRLDAMKKSAAIMAMIREQVEPTVPEEEKKRYKEEAIAERNNLFKSLLFMGDRVAALKLTLEILHYILNDEEIAYLLRDFLKQR